MSATNIRASLAILIALAVGGDALGQAAAAKSTVWHHLGIPQTFMKVRDHVLNIHGNHPGLEAKPPIKALADPANLASENLAIKTAAKIKQEEDKAQQKIKGIKYLADIGCGCYNVNGEITDALLDALDDCTEEVRYAAVKAIGEAAKGEQCENCKQKSCCSEKIVKRLAKIGWEKNDQGCWVEPSERVREAAQKAACVCCPGREFYPQIGPTPVNGDNGETPVNGDNGETPELETSPDPNTETPDTLDPTVPEQPDENASARRRHPLAGRPTQAHKAAPSYRVTDRSKTETQRVTDRPKTGTLRVTDRSKTDEALRQLVQFKGITKDTAASASAKPKPKSVGEPVLITVSDRYAKALPAPAGATLATRQPTKAMTTPSAPRGLVARWVSVTDRSSKANAADGKDRAGASPQPVRITQVQRLSTDKSASPVKSFVASASGREKPDKTKNEPARGFIQHIDRTSGIAQVQLDDKDVALPRGTRLKVFHRYITGLMSLGEVEVVGSSKGSAQVRPVGYIRMSKVSRGDRVVASGDDS